MSVPAVALRPYDYPWPPVTRPCVVDRGAVHDTTDPLDPALVGTDRRPVIAVGSNRSPQVLAAKMAGTAGVVPMVPARVDNLGVGHSAHVSARGYIAAAPFDQPGGLADVAMLWLTAAQLAALDASEPNYQRVSIDRERYRLQLDEPTQLPDPDRPVPIYRSRRGLLAPGGQPHPLTSQAQVQQLLFVTPAIRRILPVTDDTAEHGPDWCDTLAEPDLRRRVSALLREAVGWCADGLALG